MTPLRNIPAIRKAAEEQARDFLASADVAFRAAGWDTEMIHGGEDYADDALRLFADAFLNLLCDLTRPASRDAVARLVAERVPGLQAWEVVAGCECGGGRLQMVLRYCGMPMLDRWEPDPTPVEALTPIATHVLTEPA